MCLLAPRRSRIDFHHVVRVWLSSSSVDCNCSAEFLCMYGVDCVFCFLHCDRLQTQTSITQLNFVRPSPKAGMLTVRPLGCQGRTRTSGVSVSSGRCHTSAGVTDGGVSTRVLCVLEDAALRAAGRHLSTIISSRAPGDIKLKSAGYNSNRAIESCG